MLFSSIVSALAALLTLIAFAVDIALFAFVKHKMAQLENVEEHTKTGPGASLVSSHSTCLNSLPFHSSSRLFYARW